jgi:hypothetical protein
MTVVECCVVCLSTREVILNDENGLSSKNKPTHHF